jgi:glycosyltransferase involved in cell wall biosynthesis
LKISVITPSFNSGKSIARAIESVLLQDYTEWEHIVIDGGSIDGTVDILEQYKHLDWISEHDNGQTEAMAKGFARSKGEILVYLNADDYFHPGAFSAVMTAFRNGAKFVVGNILIKSERTGSESLNRPRIELNGMLRHWEQDAFCHNPVGYFYLREVQEHCPFNLANNSTMDLEFLLSAASRYKFTKIERTLGCYNDSVNTKTHTSQIESNYWSLQTFTYLDEYIKAMPEKEQLAFRLDQIAGYEWATEYWLRKERQRLTSSAHIRSFMTESYRKFSRLFQ